MDISTATIVGQTVHDPAIALAIGAVLTGLIKLALLAVTGLVGRLVNTKFNVENSTWKQKIAYRLVCYAENKIAGDTDKQAYVARSLTAILGNRVAPDEVEHLIEEAVVNLQVQSKGGPTS
jgi:hypothetical protein